MSKDNNPWKTLSTRTVFKNRWLTLFVDKVITPSGRPSTYTYVDGPPFVLVVAYDGEQFTLVRQYRYPLKRMMIELPGGGINAGEDVLGAAKRELQEETGFAASTWTKLGTLHNPNHATVFLAEDLTDTGSNKMSEDGIANAIHMSWADIDAAIKQGEFTDPKTLAALLLFERYRARG